MLINILIVAIALFLAVGFFGLIWSWMELLLAPWAKAAERGNSSELAFLEREIPACEKSQPRGEAAKRRRRRKLANDRSVVDRRINERAARAHGTLDTDQNARKH